MIRVIKFTEVFESTSLFFPRYIYIGEVDKFGNSLLLQNLYDLSLERPDVQNYLLGEQVTMSWEILVQLGKQVARKKKTKKRLLDIKQVNVREINKIFTNLIYRKGFGYLEDVESGRLKYIDDYSKEWEILWKNS